MDRPNWFVVNASRESASCASRRVRNNSRLSQLFQDPTRIVQAGKMSSNSSLAKAGHKQKHKWSLNFASKSKADRDLPSPPGFNANLGYSHSEASQEVDSNLIVKKSWDIALAPLKQIPMNLFIMYMAGNSISIFPIMMVGMLFLGPIKAIFNFNKTFKLIEGNQAIMQKFIYLVGNLGCIGLALYKCKSMGLLPTHASDWLDFVESPQRIEFSGGGLAY